MADAERKMVSCPHCGTTNRFPTPKKTIELTCGKCKGKFYYAPGGQVTTTPPPKPKAAPAKSQAACPHCGTTNRFPTPKKTIELTCGKCKGKFYYAPGGQVTTTPPKPQPKPQPEPAKNQTACPHCGKVYHFFTTTKRMEVACGECGGRFYYSPDGQVTPIPQSKPKAAPAKSQAACPHCGITNYFFADEETTEVFCGKCGGRFYYSPDGQVTTTPPQPKAKPQPKPQPKAKPQPKPQPKAKPQPKPQPKAKPHPKPQPKPQPTPKAAPARRTMTITRKFSLFCAMYKFRVKMSFGEDFELSNGQTLSWSVPTTEFEIWVECRIEIKIGNLKIGDDLLCASYKFPAGDADIHAVVSTKRVGVSIYSSGYSKLQITANSYGEQGDETFAQQVIAYMVKYIKEGKFHYYSKLPVYIYAIYFSCKKDGIHLKWYESGGEAGELIDEGKTVRYSSTYEVPMDEIHEEVVTYGQMGALPGETLNDDFLLDLQKRICREIEAQTSFFATKEGICTDDPDHPISL